MKNKYALIILVATFALLAFLRLQYPDLDHGDEFSDANILSAGENFFRFGFIRTKFLPMFEVNADSPRNLYTHIPPLSDISNGLLRIVFRSDSLVFFRAFALFVAFLNLLFWYLFIKNFTGQLSVALWAGLFYLTNSMFLFCMDSLHQPSYADALRSVIFFLYFKILTTPKKKPFIYLFVWFLYFIVSLFTFEYLLYLALFFIFFPLCFRKEKKIFIPKLFICLLMLAPVFGFLLHFLQNAWYFGGAGGAFEDLKRAAVERVVHSSDSAFKNLNLSAWWQLALARHASLAFMFNSFGLLTFLFICFLLFNQLSKESKQAMGPLMRLCVLFVILGISWYVTFPAHTVAHAFVNFLARHLVPAASLFFAFLVYIVFTFLKEKHPQSRVKLAFIPLLIVWIAATGILKSQLPVTQNKRVAAKDFLKFKGCLLGLKAVSQPKNRVGVNYYRMPFMRYYTQRNCEIIFDRTTLEKMSPPPRFFIFLPYNDQRSFELLAFIQEKYKILFNCPSFRFPSLFFELKNENTHHQ
ncbi:MAG: hypothetical protein AMJ95_00400 [Omnitrophica WOR_2 bacterium SM23_72]|nr:MAG: hypothetical protein AMJ95_00400 [Omnitrophica WOR_2 bacterium SM23_72]